MLSDYTTVDLSRMLQSPKCSVFCQTKDELKALYDNLKNQCAEYCKYWSFEDMENYWEPSDIGFTLITDDDRGPEGLSWCDKEWFTESGYVLIEFSEIANISEIEESEMSIEILLGHGV